MGLQRIYVAGSKLCARIPTLKQFDITLRRGLLCGNRLCTISRTLCVSYISSSLDFHTSTRPNNFQPQIVGFSHIQFPVCRRDYSTTNTSEKNESLVYRGRVHGMFRGLKIFSLATSALGLLLQPYLWYSLQDMSLLATVPLFAVVNTFVFTNPFLIHFLAKRYVNDLYFNPKTKEFSATLLTFFARKEILTFKAEDVHVPDLPGMFSMFTAKGRPLFVDERDFTSMEVYKHLMGFDRPLDLRYSSNTTKQEEKID